MPFRYLFAGWIVLILCVGAKAQSIDSHANRLFFNTFTNTPDSTITGFLKLYMPALQLNRSPGAWISYAPSDTLRAQEEIHSFIFKKHPFFTEKFTTGHIDFFCKRYEGPKLLQNITGVQLWFEFVAQQEAEIAFSRLVDMFILVSSDKRINSVNGAMKAAFINRNDKNGFTRVRLSMMGDNISTNKYKILFEAGNDL